MIFLFHHDSHFLFRKKEWKRRKKSFHVFFKNTLFLSFPFSLSFLKRKPFIIKRENERKRRLNRSSELSDSIICLFLYSFSFFLLLKGDLARIRKMKKEKLCGSCRSKDRSIFDWIRTNTFHFPFSLILSCQVSLLTVKDFSFEKRKDFMGTWAWAPKRLLFEHSRNEIFLFLKKNHFQ